MTQKLSKGNQQPFLCILCKNEYSFVYIEFYSDTCYIFIMFLFLTLIWVGYLGADFEMGGGKWKCNENVSFANYTSEIRLSDCSKMAINRKKYSDATIYWHHAITKFFWRRFIFLVKFSYWSNFYLNIITGSGAMTILFYKRLTRNPKIGNTTIWVLPNI